MSVRYTYHPRDGLRCDEKVLATCTTIAVRIDNRLLPGRFLEADLYQLWQLDHDMLVGRTRS
jgi:hypothetical protein